MIARDIDALPEQMDVDVDGGCGLDLVCWVFHWGGSTTIPTTLVDHHLLSRRVTSVLTPPPLLLLPFETPPLVVNNGTVLGKAVTT